MIRNMWVLSLMVLVAVSFGCSESNSNAPQVNEVHPDSWISLHGAEARSEVDFASCRSCHGIELLGAGSAPSCFSSAIGTQNCHAGGPGAPHPIDGSFLDPANHGPQAKADLTVCQACHGEAGGAGSNPRFNIGISAAGGTGCEASGCHSTNYAHPENWAGPNNTFHYTAGNIETACTLCHGELLDGDGVGTSCLGCHSSATTFALDCTFCHGNPPEGTASTGVPHGDVADVSLHNVCVICHGMKESAAGGGFAPVTDYALFDKTTETLGEHWNGKINMNGETGYNEGNQGCDTAVCHINVSAFQLSDSGLEVQLGDYGTGDSSVAPHIVGEQWLLPDQHAAEAIGANSSCLDCHTAAGLNIQPLCSECHLAAINYQLGTCSSCHNNPPDSAGPVGDMSPNRAGAHGGHGALGTDACNSCHDGAGSGTLTHYDDDGLADVAFLSAFNGNRGTATYNGPILGTCSNISCHGGQTTPRWQTGTLDVATDCTSCHERGPAAGVPEDNSPYSGAFNHHGSLDCTTCHDPAKLAIDHFSGLDTPEFEGDPAATIVDAFGYDPNAATPTCTTGLAGCHPTDSRSWFDD